MEAVEFSTSWFILKSPAFCVKDCGSVPTLPKYRHMTALVIVPMFAAAGYSLIYLLGGGGLVGALAIFVIAKMRGK